MSIPGPYYGSKVALPGQKIILRVYRSIPAGSPTRIVDSAPLPVTADVTSLPMSALGNEFLSAWPCAPLVTFSSPINNSVTITVYGWDTVGRRAISSVVMPASTTAARLIMAFSNIEKIALQTTGPEVGVRVSVGDSDPANSNHILKVPALGLPLIYGTWGYSLVGWRRASKDDVWVSQYHGWWQPGRLHNDVNANYDPRGLWAPHYDPGATSGLPDGKADYIVGHHVNHRHNRMVYHIARRL